MTIIIKFNFAGVFDQLMIDTTDGKFPLLQLGQVANKTPQLIVVNMTTSPQVNLISFYTVLLCKAKRMYIYIYFTINNIFALHSKWGVTELTILKIVNSV